MRLSSNHYDICSNFGCLGPIPQGIFGVPLPYSIRYANVAISLINDEGQSYIYGYVPIVVAKCGVFLKEKGESKERHQTLHPFLT